MKFTFGIVTSGPSDALDEMIESIHAQRCDKYEIIVVGGNDPIVGYNVTWVPFNEHATPKPHITRKKNIIAQLASYSHIVMAHDYFTFADGWYDGWLEFGSTFDIACNCIMTKEGFRHSDWVVDVYLLWEKLPQLKDKFWDVALSYDQEHTLIQYISGNYFVVSTEFMKYNLMNESLFWGDAEDLFWSRQIRDKTTFRFNPHSLVAITKPGKWAPGLLPNEYLKELLNDYSDIV